MTSAPDSLRPTRALVVVNFASSNLLQKNLQSAKLGSVCVIVVDNYSTDSERRNIQALVDRQNWTLVPMSDNRGFGAAVNAGARAAFALGCQSLVFLNPDAKIDARTLESLFKHSETYVLDVACPLIRDSAGRMVFHGCEVDLRSGATRSLRPGLIDSASEEGRICSLLGPKDGWMPWLTGACMSINRELFLKVGGFDESYFLYWEDVDFSVRANRLGGRLVVRRDLVVLHDEGGTQERAHGSGKSSTYYYYNCRNRLLFAVRNLRRRDVVRWALCTPEQSWRILKRGGRRHIVESPRGGVSAIMGTLAGLGIALCPSGIESANEAGRPAPNDRSMVSAS